MKDLKKLKQSLDIVFDYVNNQHEGECKKDAMNNLELAIKQVENLALCGVSQQRELLLAYEKSQQPKTWFMSKNEAECRIDDFLANNCG